MKIIFDSEKQKEIILNNIAGSEKCPDDIGIDRGGCYCNCYKCLENAIECYVAEKS